MLLWTSSILHLKVKEGLYLVTTAKYSLTTLSALTGVSLWKLDMRCCFKLLLWAMWRPHSGHEQLWREGDVQVLLLLPFPVTAVTCWRDTVGTRWWFVSRGLVRSETASREVQGLVVQRSAASPESWVAGSSAMAVLKQVFPLVGAPGVSKSPLLSSADPPNEPTRLSKADIVLAPVGENWVSSLSQIIVCCDCSVIFMVNYE